MLVTSLPTTYAGVHFRSRLEARWAAFFDRVGWSWAYKPLDLPGWSPDFVLLSDHRNVLVEVTPTFTAPQGLFSMLSASATSGGMNCDILVVGAGLTKPEFWSCPSFGWLGEHTPDGHMWAHAVPHSDGGMGFCSELYSYRNRITGLHNGDLGAGSNEYDDVIRSAWINAGNATQWNVRSAA
ncbi:hypothetical protein ACLBXM_09335 [Xanthobacteraceae bacterium A53D]